MDVNVVARGGTRASCQWAAPAPQVGAQTAAAGSTGVLFLLAGHLVVVAPGEALQGDSFSNLAHRCANSSLALMRTACSRALRPSLLRNTSCTCRSSRASPNWSLWTHAAAANCSLAKRTWWSSAERGSLERNWRALARADPAKLMISWSAAAEAGTAPPFPSCKCQ
eukprot:scaffold9072_cov62-Phaeocystis_antarctica.AAC.7